MSVTNLADSIKKLVDYRIKNETRAIRGTINNGVFTYGARSYNYILAVDADSTNGRRLWAQKSANNSVVIIGE